MNAWVPIKEYKNKASVAAPADEPISKDITITAGGARMCVFAVKVSNVGAGGLVIKVQDSVNGDTWNIKTKASAAITVDGTHTLSFLAEVATDQPDLPMLHKCMVLLDGAGSCDIDSVRILQED